MKTDLFQHEVIGVTKTLGRNHNVDIVFEGDSASTDGTTIRMPALPSSAELSNSQARGLRGYADHETAGIRYSDRYAWTDLLGRAQPHETWKAYADAIEDVRVERQHIRDYPGTQKNIAGAIELQAKQVLDAFAKDPTLAANDKAMGALAITMMGRKRMGTAVTECDQVLSKLNPSLVKDAEAWCDSIDKLADGPDGTKQSIKLAQDILGNLGSFTPPPPPPPSAGGTGSGGGGSGGGGGMGSGNKPDKQHGGSSAGGKAGDTGADSGDGRSNVDAQRNANGPGQEGGGGGVGAGDGSPSLGGDYEYVKVFDPDLGKAVEREVAQITKEAIKNQAAGAYRVYSTRYDKWHTRHDTDNKYGDNRTFGPRMRGAGAISSYEASVAGMKGHISVMRRKIERMVLSTQRRDWNTAQEYGYIDPKRLTQAAMGSLNVHRVRSDRAEMDTALGILIDLSGSMSGAKARLSQQIAIALAQALDTIGVAYAIYGHNTRTDAAYVGKGGKTVKDTDWYNALEASHAAGIMWGREVPIDMYEFKSFDERLPEAKGGLGSIASMIGGANADADAIMYAWGKLKERRERRKIMFVLNDGQPAWGCYLAQPGGPAYHHRSESACGVQTKRAVKAVMDQGCELVGIGILDDSVKQYYPKWAVSESLEDFTNKTMDMLARVLIGDRVRVSGKVAA
jgi:cobalamin biosynthesis protein CobT